MQLCFVLFSLGFLHEGIEISLLSIPFLQGEPGEPGQPGLRGETGLPGPRVSILSLASRVMNIQYILQAQKHTDHNCNPTKCRIELKHLVQ